MTAGELRSETPKRGMNKAEARMAAALKLFGWTCTDEFWQRYYSDPWVFNLANAVERLTPLSRTAGTPMTSDKARHPVTGRFLAFDCEVDCLEHCAGLCGNMPSLAEGDDK